MGLKLSLLEELTFDDQLVSEATFKCGQKSQIVRCRTCLKKRIVRQSAAKIVKFCGEIAANIH